MTLTQYAYLALRTAPKPAPKHLSITQFDLVHAVFGVVGEVLELAHHFDAGANPFKLDRVNLLEELGDVSWYLPLMERHYGVTGIPAMNWLDLTSVNHRPDRSELRKFFRRVFRQDIRDARKAYQELRRAAAETHDLLKKHIVYGKELNATTVHVWIQRIVVKLINLIYALDLSVIDVFSANIAKLKARFPDGFTEHAALNRDLQRETAALTSSHASQ